MAMRLWLVSAQDKPALAQAYSAYMAELVPHEVQITPDPYFDLYWQEPSDRFPYVFGDGKPEGFAFIRRPDEPDLEFEMAEFCIYTAGRRSGIGTHILRDISKRHPGRWEVSVLMTNAAGLAFWPKALRATKVQDLRMQEDDISRDYRFTAT
ncbi:hypothetical protein [Jannaschia sp. CCS1]|uniref:hypothetical protein n=1 Tax=Jannaschia sp. (strain CCS1) TaxID=290400 RepID=UPI000053B3FA|nr:hypothetical protein [Jannaschia sp. CCS1]ABD52966.1 hypothetical protein Jann_0049 [Jannaschia sp. CCS1]